MPLNFPPGMKFEKAPAKVERDYSELERLAEIARERPLEPNLNLWGTTADPVEGEDWQTQLKNGPLAELGVPLENVFDPKKRDGTYTVEDTENEAKHLRDGKFHYMKVTNESGGILSALESGVVAIRAMLGANAYLDISSLESKGNITETTVRARELVRNKLARFQELLQGKGNITTSEQMSEQEWLSQAAQEMKEPLVSEVIDVATVEQRSQKKPSLKAQVYLSGTGVPATSSNAKGSIIRALGAESIKTLDSFKLSFNPKDMEREDREREESAVSLHVITNERLSIGGAAETFWLAAGALLNGQKFGLYLEDSNEQDLRLAARYAQEQQRKTPDSTETPDEQVAREAKEAFKVRRSLRIHLKALEEDFPGLLYLASSPEDLARWGAEQVKGYTK